MWFRCRILLAAFALLSKCCWGLSLPEPGDTFPARSSSELNISIHTPLCRTIMRINYGTLHHDHGSQGGSVGQIITPSFYISLVTDTFLLLLFFILHFDFWLHSTTCYTLIPTVHLLFRSNQFNNTLSLQWAKINKIIHPQWRTHWDTDIIFI